MPPQVYSDHPTRYEDPAGFFGGFAANRIEQAFAFLEMTGRLIDQRRTEYVFFDHQKSVFPFDNRGDGDMGFPDHGEIESKVRLYLVSVQRNHKNLTIFGIEFGIEVQSKSGYRIRMKSEQWVLGLSGRGRRAAARNVSGVVVEILFMRISR